MKAQLLQVKGNTYIGRGDSGHWVSIDTSEKNNGMDGASGPMEMILIALAGCSSIDVELILKKKRIVYDRFEVFIDSERSEDHPKVFTRVHCQFKFYGMTEQNPNAIQQALDLSFGKYCSVAGMVGKTAEITYGFDL